MGRWPALLAYGGLGMPLAMVALPIYIVVPKFYADQTQLSLSLIGAVLLLTRLLDALSDPLLGYWIDRQRSYRHPIWLALPLLALAYVALFHPMPRISPLVWMAVSLLMVYFAYSLATIAHQAWGASLSQDPIMLTRINGTREACGLVGVMLAAAVPQVWGMNSLTGLLLLCLLVAGVALRYAPTAQPKAAEIHSPTAFVEPDQCSLLALWRVWSVPWQLCWHNLAWRKLMWVFLLNGIASAIPATLVLFFVRDVLHLEAYAGAFLALYFLAGACSMPLWVVGARRLGLAGAWLLGMLLTVAAFVGALTLEAGSGLGYAIVSALSGLALGADMALPSALLARVIQRAGHAQQHEGAYFGLWHLVTKLNLAAAAGLALPLCEWLGYTAQTDGIAPMTLATSADVAWLSSVGALKLVYCALPCGLKLIAAASLWRAKATLM